MAWIFKRTSAIDIERAYRLPDSLLRDFNGEKLLKVAQQGYARSRSARQ